ncbi:MAG: hypothetical protein JSR99_03480 [Proteobacteria bacterium]|nr:hypothetical protein [Pseudomonadota bacterium]
MKLVLPLIILIALSATSYAAVKSNSAHYLLLHPSATIETDFCGHCARIRNVSEGVVYLPLLTAEDFNASLTALLDQLHVDKCNTQ